MTDHATTTEIADLLHHLRRLSEDRPTDPREQAAVLARKAELLTRIADQRAQQWGPCDWTTQAREIAREAQAIPQTHTASPEQVGPNQRRTHHRSNPPGGAKSKKNSGAISG